jgi:transposase
VAFRVDPVVLVDDDRSELEQAGDAHLTPQRVARRARIILLWAEGRPIRQIGIEVGMDQHQVGMWRRRFIAESLDGLEDQPRSGRPRRIGHERMNLAAVATSEKDVNDPIAAWTHQDLADSLADDGIPISASQVGRILKAMQLGVTRVRGWLNRRDDPELWERVRDVYGLYLTARTTRSWSQSMRRPLFKPRNANTRTNPQGEGNASGGSESTSAKAPLRCSPRSTCTPVRCSQNRSPARTTRRSSATS